MAQYISKSALVAEIEKLFEKAGNSLGEYRNGAEHTLISIKDFIDTLEVKEADFGTEFYKYIEENFNVYDDGNETLQTKDKKSLIGMVDVENIAKRFFELGISAGNKALKGE